MADILPQMITLSESYVQVSLMRHKAVFNAVIVVDPDRTFIHGNQFFTYIPDI